MDSSAWQFEARYEQWLPGLALMRDALIEPLSDADLVYDLGGSSLTWGQLIDDCAEMQRSYLDAFTTLDQTWAPPRSALEHRSTVAEILERFHRLDRELELALGSFTVDEWDAVIVRPDGAKRSRRGQLEIYAQFMLIFLAKATVYARPEPDLAADREGGRAPPGAVALHREAPPGERPVQRGGGTTAQLGSLLLGCLSPRAQCRPRLLVRPAVRARDRGAARERRGCRSRRCDPRGP